MSTAPTPRLAVEVTEDGASALVRVSGEIDLDSSPELRDELRRLIEGGCTRIVVDLAAVTFMDSTGLGVLARALRRAREKDGTLILASPQPAVRKILEITHLVKVFTIEN